MCSWPVNSFVVIIWYSHFYLGIKLVSSGLPSNIQRSPKNILYPALYSYEEKKIHRNQSFILHSIFSKMISNKSVKSGQTWKNNRPLSSYSGSSITLPPFLSLLPNGNRTRLLPVCLLCHWLSYHEIQPQDLWHIQHILSTCFFLFVSTNCIII